MTPSAGSSADVRLESNQPEISSPSPNENRIKILHIINDLSIGGAEMMLYRLLSQKGHNRFDSVVISLMDRGSLRNRIEGLGIRVYSPKMRQGLPTVASIWRLIRLVRQINPDLIQGWLYHGSLAGQIGSLAMAQRVPVLWSIHFSIYSLSFEKKLTATVVRLCAHLSRLAAGIIFVSRTSKVQHEQLGFDISKSLVFPNGIDADDFAPSEDARRSVRSELGLSQDAVLIGNISRYHTMKDHPNFLRAAALITKRYPEVKFFLAGRYLDASNRTLIEMIHEGGLDDHVSLLGERLDIARLVAALDIFCLSSSYGESFPLIVGEAMSSGVPCVVTDVGDSSWMVNGTGRVVPPRDAGALASACIDLLEMGPEGRTSLGSAARNRVVGLFSLKTVVSEYEALYEKIVALKRQ